MDSPSPKAYTDYQYCESLASYKRLLTREVKIGTVALGGAQPIRIQSMTTTDTMDTDATIEQSLRMVESGAEYVRITAPSMNEARNLKAIKEGLRKRGCEVPLIADIHFTPNAAEEAARIVEKVRVNPGNYADKKKFNIIEYDDAQYNAEIERIYTRFTPLVKICKEEGTAMRIGTNHGSLSDRIMSRFGDTALGMVESAMEFVRVCEDHDFHDIVLSMKASNPQVMVHAYRLLVHQLMSRKGPVYPLHLGVTEAGEGEDGRIKSALGISTLLLDGLGDTVRVSLTEEPEYESPVAQFLVDFVEKRNAQEAEKDVKEIISPLNPFEFNRHKTREVHSIGGANVPRVIGDLSTQRVDRHALKSLGYHYVTATDKYNFKEIASDFVFLGNKIAPFKLPGALKAIYLAQSWEQLKNKEESFPYFGSLAEYRNASERHSSLNFVEIDASDLEETELREAPLVAVLNVQERFDFRKIRAFIFKLIKANYALPIVLRIAAKRDKSFYEDEAVPEKFKVNEIAQDQLFISTQLAPLVLEGLVDALWMDEMNENLLRTSFGILQAARLRTTKTEYISCPSCGRTLFDLQDTTAKIRKRTEHLKGLKIGIMGCIVNGPGEMADADYGYVGVGVDKIALYRGQVVVEKGVKAEEAVDKLIELIKSDDNWIEPGT